MAFGFSDHRRPLRAALTAVAALSLLAACGREEPAPAPPAEPETPAFLEIAEGAEGLIYRYRDPGSGEVISAADPQAIPEPARRAVVVHDPAVPPPAGADFVADLSGSPPWRAEAVAGFAFPPPPRKAAGEGGGASKATPEIVLFATEWCGYCAKARKFFERRKVPFTEVDLEKTPKARERLEALARKAGVRPDSLSGVPIIFIGDKPVLGWDEGQVKRLLGGG